MKSLLLAFSLALYCSSSELISTNILDGPNNQIQYGQQNEIHGRDNTVGGWDNTIRGNANNVHGDENNLRGSQNTVDGQGNIVSGYRNQVHGEGNMVLGSDATPQQKQAIKQRIMEMFNHRNLQWNH